MKPSITAAKKDMNSKDSSQPALLFQTMTRVMDTAREAKMDKLVKLNSQASPGRAHHGSYHVASSQSASLLQDASELSGL